MSDWKSVVVVLGVLFFAVVCIWTGAALTWLFTLPPASSYEEAAERHWHYYQELNGVSE